MRILVYFILTASMTVTSFQARAFELEPRAYSNAPVGMNFLLLGYLNSSGALVFDTSLPITDANARVNSGFITYVNVIDIGGKSAKIGGLLPYATLTADGYLAGDYKYRDTSGIADPSLFLSVNIYGAPALKASEYGSYRQKTIVGISLTVTPPLGEYDPGKIINLGTNRWTFEPEIGISRAIDNWRLEAAASIYLYTDNDNFDNGKKRQQQPIYAVQFNVVYTFANGIWASLGSTYYTGGETTIDGIDNNDTLDNVRTGFTVALPVSPSQSVKMFASTGVSTRTGTDFDSLGAAWQYRW